MPATPYKGALGSKRKSDLADIASALGLRDADLPSKTRDGLEAAIRDHLVLHRDALEQDVRFEGLYSSLDRAARAARASVGG